MEQVVEGEGYLDLRNITEWGLDFNRASRGDVILMGEGISAQNLIDEV